MKLDHPGEDMMCMTAKNLQYRVKGALEVYEYCATTYIKHK